MITQNSINLFYSRIAQLYSTGEALDIVARKSHVTAGELLTIYRDPEFNKVLESVLKELAAHVQTELGETFEGDILTRWNAARKAARKLREFNRVPDGWDI